MQIVSKLLTLHLLKTDIYMDRKCKYLCFAKGGNHVWERLASKDNNIHGDSGANIIKVAS